MQASQRIAGKHASPVSNDETIIVVSRRLDEKHMEFGGSFLHSIGSCPAISTS
jgi:hypothetical protein